MINLNQNQILAIIIGSCSFLGGATTQLTTLFGTAGAGYIIALCLLVAGITSIVLTVTTGQSQAVKTVLAMPGVDHIDVNGKANATLAALAIDPSVDKIGPIPSATAKVEQTARGG